MKNFKISWFQLILVGLGVQSYQKKKLGKKGDGKKLRGQKGIDGSREGRRGGGGGG